MSLIKATGEAIGTAQEQVKVDILVTASIYSVKEHP